MGRIQFTDESNTLRSRTIQKKKSAMTRLIQKCSFGLIQTDAQVQMCKLSIIILGVVWFLISTIFSSEDSVIEPPTAELINSVQPVEPL